MNDESTSPDELTSETWNRLEDLLEEVLARPASERQAYLDAACAGNVTLRRQIESLIAAHDQTDSPLDRIGRTLAEQSPDVSPEWNGRTLGAYELVREIGRGGMGVVFLARRNDGQYERDVALKVIRSPLHDARERRRLVAERQTLARLSHPGIAQLYDGGVTSDGLPYFTMEYVNGRPIDRYCDERGLDVVALVQLFLQVCDAVAAAHRSLVVHRDLKPAHVLVTPDGVVKLLDFGIAKQIQPSASAPVTRPGLGPFTPDYASPEQVRGEAITTTSDVYALGAILYQLLTGIRPHRFASKSPADIQRAICDEAPLRPSVALAQSREAAAGRGSWLTRAGRSRTERRLRGDLDTILIKALHKDPTRRYESVDLLRQDLANHLGGRPVNARPDGWAYRARKFAVRHRVGVSAATLILISLVAGVVATEQQARRARQQSAVAASEREGRGRARQARLGAPDRHLPAGEPRAEQRRNDHGPGAARSGDAPRRVRAGRGRGNTGRGPAGHQPGVREPRAVRAG
jgi:serine/threonine protein kinase